MAYLEAQIGGEVKQFTLATDRMIHIGRSDNNELVLNNDSTSRRHAMVQYSGEGSFYISDLGSRNGTFVNDARISRPVLLSPGDRIRIGIDEFIFRNEVTPNYSVTGVESMSTNVIFAMSLVTVLVADIRDFTGLSQRIDAGTLSEVTGTLFHDAGKVLHDLGAWEQKYIGDAVMAVWLHKRDEPELGELVAVLQGLAKLETIAAGLQSQFRLGTPVRFGAAINTGWASVGNAGSIASSDYTAVGETVNRTFRLESSTKEISHDLVIGQETYDFLNRAAPMSEYFKPFTVRLKGYNQPAPAYATDLVHLPSLIASLDGE